jgi:hypothetical protein
MIMGAKRTLPGVIAIGSDFYSTAVAGPVDAGVVHADGCTRAPCECFGIAAEVQETAADVLVLRLLLAGEVVGTVRLLPVGDRLAMFGASTYRAAATEDWRWHHLVVTETLLRESARVADERGLALECSWEEPQALLAELGFTRAGLIMRRAAVARG